MTIWTGAEMTKWDARMMALVQLVASWSKDPSTQVGAAIVDPKNRVVSMGFNGFPRAVADTTVDRAEKLRRTIHAEENALLFAQRPVEGCTLYVTHPPCAMCTAKIIQAGIVRVVAPRPSPDFAERWAADIASSATMFIEAGVGLEYAG